MQPSLPRWDQLYDLALVYVALTHSSKHGDSTAETAAVLESIMHYVPNASSEEVEQAIDRAKYAFFSLSGERMLESAVISLRKHLEMDQRVEILDDLASLATADGSLVSAEAAFLQQLAKHWEIEQDRSR